MFVLFLLENWKGLLAGLLLAGATFLFQDLRLQQQAAACSGQREAQKELLQAQCLAEKKITEELSHGYQKRAAELDRVAADLKRMRNATGGKVQPALPAGGVVSPEGRGQLSGKNGLPVEELYELARDAELVGIRLDTCQEYVRTIDKE